MMIDPDTFLDNTSDNILDP